MIKAFTLVEMLLVMGLISVTVGIGANITYKNTQRHQVEQAGQKLQSAYEQARAYALAGKKVNCIGNERLAGWGIRANATSYQLVEYCDNFVEKTPTTINYSASGTVTLTGTPNPNPIIFRPLGQGIYSDPLNPFNVMTRAVLSGAGFSKEINVYPKGQINALALVEATPAPTSIPVATSTPPVVATNTPPVVATSTPINTPTPTTVTTYLAYSSTTTTTGNMGGTSGANSICQTNAAAAGETGTFKAWVSTGSVSAKTNISPGDLNKAYYLVNGVKIADNYADLTDGTLDAPIDRTITNVAYQSGMWTGTTALGTATASRCNEWTSAVSTVFGMRGLANSITATWSNSTDLACNTPRPVYCFQIGF